MFDGIEPISIATAPGRIAKVIRSSILDGTFAPGTQLTETQLAERLNVSRGPVREAMQRLVQEGLLWTKPHHGTFVVDLGHEDIADIYLARRAVESTAAIRVMDSADRDAALVDLDHAVAAIDEAVQSDSWPAIIDADCHFHETLVNAAHSPRLTRMFRTLTAEARLCMLASVEGDPEWVRRVVAQHLILASALRRGDKLTVQAAIDEHMNLDSALEYRLRRDSNVQDREFSDTPD
ncbi:GntR family transcriptional regulator [Mycolicibacterium vaccae]|uniref:GntR family transcriptional regulator n=1 Tax=Mycolicibacterium vaccae TaxID=1810 RepID=UPI003CFF1813